MNKAEDFPGQHREIERHEVLNSLMDKLQQATLESEDHHLQFGHVAMDLIKFIFGLRREEGGTELFRDIVQYELERFTQGSVVEQKLLAGRLLNQIVSTTLLSKTEGEYNREEILARSSQA